MIISTGLISKYLTFSSRAKLCSFGQADDDNLFTSWWWQWQFVYKLMLTMTICLQVSKCKKRGLTNCSHHGFDTDMVMMMIIIFIMQSSWCMRKVMSLLIIISFSPSIPSQRYVGGGDIRNALQWMISSPSFQILKTNPLIFHLKINHHLHPHQ